MNWYVMDKMNGLHKNFYDINKYIVREDKKKSQRFLGIDLWKIIFIIIIAVHHLGLGCLKRGYIGVEFFFIVSGFFIWKAFKKRNDNTLVFTARRIKTLYPDYLIALLLLSVVLLWNNSIDFSKIVVEALMLQQLGIISSNYNYPAWYISVLITASPVVYHMLRKMKIEWFNWAISIFSIAVFTWFILSGFGVEQWSTVYGLHTPWLRGFAELGIGTLVGEASELIEINDKNKTFFRIVEVVCIMIFVVFSFIPGRMLDWVCLIVCPFFVLSLTSKYSISAKFEKCKPIHWLGQYEYLMYLNHCVAIKFVQIIFKGLDTHIWWIKLGQIVVLFVILICIVIMIDFLKKNCKKLANKFGKRY